MVTSKSLQFCSKEGQFIHILAYQGKFVSHVYSICFGRTLYQEYMWD